MDNVTEISNGWSTKKKYKLKKKVNILDFLY